MAQPSFHRIAENQRRALGAADRRFRQMLSAGDARAAFDWRAAELDRIHAFYAKRRVALMSLPDEP